MNRSITQDANLANSRNADALVEIHLNSNAGTPGTGTEAFVSIRDAGRARAIANAVLQRIAALGYANRGVKTQTNAAGQDAFGILRLTNMPAVLVELAFINNPNDMARFDVNQMAQAVAEGIRETVPLAGSGGGSGGGGLPAFPGTLIRQGMQGESVRQIQRCLNSVGTRRPEIQRLVEDGIFGPRTLDAVRTFQRIFGLSPDGIVGPLTWGRLAQECADGAGFPAYPGAPIRVCQSGESVRQIQRCLNRVLGTGLATDGNYGPATLAAILTFQRSRGLTVDGIIGPLTWAALGRECG